MSDAVTSAARPTTAASLSLAPLSLTRRWAASPAALALLSLEPLRYPSGASYAAASVVLACAAVVGTFSLLAPRSTSCFMTTWLLLLLRLTFHGTWVIRSCFCMRSPPSLARFGVAYAAAAASSGLWQPSLARSFGHFLHQFGARIAVLPAVCRFAVFSRARSAQARASGYEMLPLLPSQLAASAALGLPLLLALDCLSCGCISAAVVILDLQSFNTSC